MLLLIFLVVCIFIGYYLGGFNWEDLELYVNLVYYVIVLLIFFLWVMEFLNYFYVKFVISLVVIVWERCKVLF